MKKYIFLDFDGVITTRKSKWDLDLEKCKLIQEIIDNTGAKVVISSSWRMGSLEKTKEYLTDITTRVPFVLSFIDDIIDITVRMMPIQIYGGLDRETFHTPRGSEIEYWLETNVHKRKFSGIVEGILGKDYQYVILDDNNDMLYHQKNNFIQTNSNLGINIDDVIKAIKILNNEKEKI